MIYLQYLSRNTSLYLQVDGTIWTDIDDSRLYKQLDLQEVDRLFSAYQKNGIMVSELYCTVLYCTVLHCTALWYVYCTVLYCTVLW